MDYENIYDKLLKFAEYPGNHLDTLLACAKLLFSLPYDGEKYLIDQIVAKDLIDKIFSEKEKYYKIFGD